MSLACQEGGWEKETECYLGYGWLQVFVRPVMVRKARKFRTVSLIYCKQYSQQILTLFIVLRIQWLHARAQVNRWSEEISLLLEEMRRVDVFLVQEAKGWKKRTLSRSVSSPELNEGLAAYALHQAHIALQLRGHFLTKWNNVKRWDLESRESGVTCRDDVDYYNDE